MAEILFVANPHNIELNRITLHNLQRNGHIVDYQEVFAPEAAEIAKRSIPEMGVVVLQNIGGLDAYRDKCHLDPIEFTRDMVSAGRPVIVYTHALPDSLQTQLRDAGATVLDSMDSPPAKLAAAVDRALQSARRAAGGRGGRQ